jgi:hypothetical protein
LLVLAAAALIAGAAWAGTRAPVLDAPRGEKCVEDVATMRRDHMGFLKHQRDDTVHRGMRGARHSLSGCIECHANGKDGSVLGSPAHFCQGCHAFAAVKLDCFECHSSRTRAAQAAGTGGKPP